MRGPVCETSRCIPDRLPRSGLGDGVPWGLTGWFRSQNSDQCRLGFSQVRWQQKTVIVMQRVLVPAYGPRPLFFPCAQVWPRFLTGDAPLGQACGRCGCPMQEPGPDLRALHCAKNSRVDHAPSSRCSDALLGRLFVVAVVLILEQITGGPGHARADGKRTDLVLPNSSLSRRDPRGRRTS